MGIVIGILDKLRRGSGKGRRRKSRMGKEDGEEVQVGNFCFGTWQGF